MHDGCGDPVKVHADLHIHSCHSMATSRSMSPSRILETCVVKGIGVIGSGDALHPGWQAEWRDFLENDAGILVLPSAVVEGNDRVHHLIIMEEFEDFSALRERMAPHSRDIGSTGRPHVHLSGYEIAREVHGLGGLIGPAHAFTPWTSVFAYFDTLHECYGDEPVDFLELGLSADNSYGASIPFLAGVPFLTHSDAHSPDMAKCGREFTTFSPASLTTGGMIAAIREARIEQNVGFFPEEGKYNRTACTRCYTQYSLEEAVGHRWRCPKDRGLIKKGVSDRSRELSTGTPVSRPPYLHIIPLGEIIRTVLGVSSTGTVQCRRIYGEMISVFGNEIEVLTTVPAEEIGRVHEGVAGAVDVFRNGRIELHPGGGGKFGTFSIP